MQLTRLAAAALVALAPCAAFAVTQADFAAKTTERSGQSVQRRSEGADGRRRAELLPWLRAGRGVGGAGAGGDGTQKAVLLPEPAPTRTDTLKEFVTWARANPGHLNEPAPNGLVGFLRARYPCNKP